MSKSSPPVQVYPYVPPKKPDAKKQNTQARRAAEKHEMELDTMIEQPSVLDSPEGEYIPAEAERIGDAYARLLGVGSSRGLRYSAVGHAKGRGRRGNWPI